MTLFLKFADRLLWLAKLLTIVIMAGMTASVLIGVFFRYVIPIPMAWPPEAARFMMVAVTMFGSSIAIRQLEHAGITFLVDALPPRLRLTLYLLGNLSIAIFLAIFAYFSWRMTAEMGVRQVSSSLGMPMTVAYISMPVGGVMMLVQLLAASIEGLARFKSGGTPFASELQEAAPLSQGKSSV